MICYNKKNRGKNLMGKDDSLCKKLMSDSKLSPISAMVVRDMTGIKMDINQKKRKQICAKQLMT